MVCRRDVLLQLMYVFSSQQHKLRLFLQWSFRRLFLNSTVQTYKIYAFIISMQVIEFGKFLGSSGKIKKLFKLNKNKEVLFLSSVGL